MEILPVGIKQGATSLAESEFVTRFQKRKTTKSGHAERDQTSAEFVTPVLSNQVCNLFAPENQKLDKEMA